VNAGLHRAMTRAALQEQVHPDALDVICTANLRQDSLQGMFGHDEYHFDASAFTRGNAYVEHNRTLLRTHLAQGEPRPAWQAFGRLSHALQDFYSHSNYVALWLAHYPQTDPPPPDQIDPLDADLLAHPDLRSGKLYYPLEALYFVPGLRKLVMPFLPRDSHAWMNLDSPKRGPAFPYALSAATRRTQYEYEETMRHLPEEQVRLFNGYNQEHRRGSSRRIPENG
jgi:hypothetical protein